MAIMSGALSSFLVLFLLFVGCCSQSKQNCRLFRIDDFPCTFRIPNTPEPGPDQCGIYTTRIDNGPQCGIRRRNNQIRDLDTLGGDTRAFQIFSAGIELLNPKNYGNQVYERYEIVCPEDHLIEFRIVDGIHLEEKICPNPNKNNALDCVDYIRFYLGTEDGKDYGYTENCGRDQNFPSGFININPGRNMTAIFRTDDTRRFPGFKATLLCLNASQNSGTSVPGARKRRDVESFNEMWQKRKAHYVRLKRSNDRRRVRRALLNFEEIPIAIQNDFTFQDRVITMREAGTTIETGSVPGIRWLHVFSLSRGIRHYRTNARDSRTGGPISFPGPGPLDVVGDHAYYTTFLVDPAGILPETDAERRVLRLLEDAHFDRVLEYPDEELCEEIVNPPPFNPDMTIVDPTGPECPRPVTTAPVECDVSDEILGLAYRSRNSRILAIRTIADVILNCTRTFQPDRFPIEPGDTPPLDVTCTLAQTPNSNGFNVTCRSNRERERGVRITRCVIDDSPSVIGLCTYPRFAITFDQLSLLGVNPAPSRRLNMRFSDSTRLEDIVSLDFSAQYVQFTINCVLMTDSTMDGIPVIQPPIGNATLLCMSDDTEALSIQSCVIDEVFRLEGCASFATSMVAIILPPNISLGRHTLKITAGGGGRIAQDQVDFILSGFDI